jgi:hypothetical protein
MDILTFERCEVMRAGAELKAGSAAPVSELKRKSKLMVDFDPQLR